MINPYDYQKLAMRTSPDGHDRMLNGCMGLIGESGEVLDLIKKWKFQSGNNAEFPNKKLIEELGDVLWYCAEVCQETNDNLYSLYNDAGFERMSYDNILHVDAIFLCKLAVTVSDCWMYPDDYSIGIPYTISAIVDVIRHILRCYCGSNLEECMTQNIEKLKRRYPDGFDPDRSIHREV